MSIHDSATTQDGPHLPNGAAMELPGRGTTFVRTMAGPPDAPTLMLLHGWTASADLNWFTCYGPLSRQNFASDGNYKFAAQIFRLQMRFGKRLFAENNLRYAIAVAQINKS